MSQQRGIAGSEANPPAGRIHPVWPSILLIIGLVVLWAGERVLSGVEGARVPTASLGGACLVAALVWRIQELMAASPDRRRVAQHLALTTGGVVFAIALYAGAAFSEDASRTKGALMALFPVVLVVSASPLFALELAVFSVAFIDRYEHRRTSRAFERGLSLGLLVSAAFLANYLAKEHEVKVDLSQSAEARPSDATKSMMRDLTKPVEVTLFFPRANEVAEALGHYFDEVKGISDKLTIRRVDQALAGKRATEVGVSENGYVAVSFEKSNDKFRVGLDVKSARSALRSFDANLAKSLIKVTRGKSVAYFTSGHGERAIGALEKDDTRSPVSLIKKQLEANQYEVKSLGVAEGLGNKIPDDASIILIVGPEKPFLPEEIESLKQGIAKGARVLIALEAEREGSQLDELLTHLGLKQDKTILANASEFVAATHTAGDRLFLYSNRFSSHASVTTMTRNATKLAALFSKTGSIEKLEEAPSEMKVDIVLTALNATFRDANGNLEADEGEKKSNYGLAAAVTRTATAGAEEGRVFVMADADPMADDYIRFSGNPYLFSDIVYWLRDIKDPVLPTVSEEDVKIVHKRSEDSLWFYGTTLGMPALVALAGFYRVRSRRRR
ncbi:MAG: Gldg family protein [Deltaproteobacteria bacterium]|nr:Gldg family protein [Deltaproteobacteria bacterium]